MFGELGLKMLEPAWLKIVQTSLLGNQSRYLGLVGNKRMYCIRII